MSDAQVIMSLVGSLVLALGYWLSRRGKKHDERSGEVRDQFQRLMGEVDYWKKAAEDERDNRLEDQARARTRLAEQFQRCREVNATASRTIVNMLSGRVETHELETTLYGIEEHEVMEHHEEG